MITAAFLALAGLILSAFFSGAEIGFYRLPRHRVLLDAVAGDRIAHCLLWFVNHPHAFVATTLVGNNMANNLIAWSAVVWADQMVDHWGKWADPLSSLVVVPVVFVYGEMLPKSILYQASYRLLRVGCLLFLTSVFLLAPLALPLWMVGVAMQKAGGLLRERFVRRLARGELLQFFQEGEGAGLLRRSQVVLAENLFFDATRPVQFWCRPLARAVRVRPGTPTDDALRQLQQLRYQLVLVEDPAGKILGYLTMADLIAGGSTVGEPRPLPVVDGNLSLTAALMAIRGGGHDAALVRAANGETAGMVLAADLVEEVLGWQ